jgi:hypothetical protein
MHGRQWATDSLDIFDCFNPGPANQVVAPRFSPADRIHSLTKAEPSEYCTPRHRHAL